MLRRHFLLASLLALVSAPKVVRAQAPVKQIRFLNESDTDAIQKHFAEYKASDFSRMTMYAVEPNGLRWTIPIVDVLQDGHKPHERLPWQRKITVRGVGYNNLDKDIIVSHYVLTDGTVDFIFHRCDPKLLTIWRVGERIEASKYFHFEYEGKPPVEAYIMDWRLGNVFPNPLHLKSGEAFTVFYPAIF